MEEKKKILGKLKLNQLSKSELKKREMKVLKGGCGSCGDGCSPNTNLNESSVTSY